MTIPEAAANGTSIYLLFRSGLKGGDDGVHLASGAWPVGQLDARGAGWPRRDGDGGLPGAARVAECALEAAFGGVGPHFGVIGVTDAKVLRSGRFLAEIGNDLPRREALVQAATLSPMLGQAETPPF